MNKKLFVSVAATASLLAGCVVVATPQHANFHQQKTLSIQANDLNRLTIEAGAGSLKVIGSDSETNVTVTGHIYTTKESPNAYDFSLDRNGQHAELVARNHSSSGYWHGNSPRIDLIISLPDGMALDIEDGSGVIEVKYMNNTIDITDGSGDIYIAQGKERLNISDGSGNIKVTDFNGSSDIEDGSGSIEVTNLVGDLKLDDGSGSIYVNNVTGDVEINDGSGELKVENVGGIVTIDDGSGGITVHGAGGLKITEAGSGSLKFNDIKGEVEVDS